MHSWIRTSIFYCSTVDTSAASGLNCTEVRWKNYTTAPCEGCSDTAWKLGQKQQPSVDLSYKSLVLSQRQEQHAEARQQESSETEISSKHHSGRDTNRSLGHSAPSNPRQPEVSVASRLKPNHTGMTSSNSCLGTASWICHLPRFCL